MLREAPHERVVHACVVDAEVVLLALQAGKPSVALAHVQLMAAITSHITRENYL